MKAMVMGGGLGGASLTASVLNPSFSGIPDAKALARYLLNAVVTIKRNNLPVKIYLSKGMAEKISKIFEAMGIKFQVIPASKMTPPYIFLGLEGNYVIIKTVGDDGKTISVFRAPLRKFIEEIQSLYHSSRKRNHRKKEEEEEEVEEILMSSIDLEKFIEEHKDLFEEGE